MPKKIMKEFLLAPGPTPIPPEVLQEGALPIYHHRTPRFSSLFGRASEGLKKLFCTEHDVFTLACSGSGAMEAAVANLLSPGDRAICVETGKFGERWTKICKSYGITPVIIAYDYGKTIKPQDVAAALQENPGTKAVFTQLSETSTGCVHDIESIGAIVNKTGAVLVVDGISGIGAQEFQMDKWHVDVALTGSQKGLMLPPGLGFIACSAKAWKLVESAKSPRFYFDLRSYKKSLQKADTPYTPAISLVVQLNRALEIILGETIEGMWKRHEWMGSATRAAITALGLEFFAERPGNVLTAVTVPGSVDGVKLVKTMRDQFGVTIAGGQGDDMKGKIFRIAHLGYMDRADIIVAIATLEMVLKQLGYPLALGKGVAAAEEILRMEPFE